MRTKFHIVIYHFTGRITVNGRTHKEPTPTSTLRLIKVVNAISYYDFLTSGAHIHHVQRG